MTDIFGAMGTALYGKLAGSSALTTALGGTAIYVDQAPDGAVLPYVVYSHAAGGPENITPRDMRTHLWFIRVYADQRGSANIYDGLISNLLHKGSLSVSGWTTFWLAREEDFSLIDNLPNGNKVYMAGATYRVRLSE